MKTFSTVEECRTWRQQQTDMIGFVPTMGALHAGHLSLVEQSTIQCRHTIVSIYVNPTQFSPDEDLSKYPRNLERDLELLSGMGADAVFLPDDQMMYPQGFSTYIVESDLTQFLEGRSRPQHFRGVTTIVGKLLNIIKPDFAFFGEKDAQQFRVIRRMVEDLNYDIQLVSCPIIREENGLAMSSRNQYLSPEQRLQAGIIHSALEQARSMLESGEDSAGKIRDRMNEILLAESPMKIDYISISDSRTLEEISGTITAEILVSVAVFFHSVRLIDNFTWIPGRSNQVS